MIESLVPLAKIYLSNLILSNEEVKKFPVDFVTASMRWIRSWFLEDDPTVKAVIESSSSAVAKEAVLEVKLNELLKNPRFVEELQSQLAAYNTYHSRAKNIVNNAEIEAQGSIRIGDKGSSDAGDYDKKNIVKGGSKIKAGQDFHLGDSGINQ